jgi:hypothetical protein
MIKGLKSIYPQITQMGADFKTMGIGVCLWKFVKPVDANGVKIFRSANSGDERIAWRLVFWG